MPKKIIDKILDIVFPPRCVGCGRKNLLKFKCLCQECFENISLNNGFFCPKCSARLYEPKNYCHPAEKFVLAAAVSYQEPLIRELIHQFKYKSLKIVGEALAEILYCYLIKILPELKEYLSNFIWLTMPLHPKRENRRGFNQSFLIAKNLSQRLGGRLVNDILIKIKNTPAQAGISDYQQREENVKNSFMIKNKNIIKGKNICLVDDVFTSGATMKEAVRILKEAGAKRILGLVIAKA